MPNDGRMRERALPVQPSSYSSKNLAQLKRLARRQEAPPVAEVAPLPEKSYDIVYADPPWSYYGSAIKDAAAGKHYAMLTVDELAGLDIRRILNKRAVLFMWATGPRLHYAVSLIEKWGLHYRGVAYVWVKINKKGKVIVGQGVAPTFTKPTSEFILAATTMPTGRPFQILDLAHPQVILHQRAEHSRKPAVFRDLIVRLCGDRPRIELFARERVDGWDAWGVEEEKFSSVQPRLFGA